MTKGHSLMERTESIIIQVSPNYENFKIKEMEMFGWNLQGRQEIHEQGDAYGSPSVFSDTYVIKTRVSQYVKLHFIRSLSQPNLNQIRQIESEYFNLQFPNSPALTGPGCFTLFWVFGGCVGFIVLFEKNAPPVLPVSILGIAMGVLWIKSTLKKRNEFRRICEDSLERMNYLKGKVQTLL